MKDQEHSDNIARAILNLSSLVKQAKEAGLQVRLCANGSGQTITSRIIREYDFDLTEGS